MRLGARRRHVSLRLTGFVFAIIAAVVLSNCSLGSGAARTRGRHHHGGHTTPATPTPTPPKAWLGVNYNSSSGLQLRQLSSLGVVYDRDGGLEAPAGQTAAAGTSLGRALSQSYAAGMVPDVLVDPAESTTGCTSNPQSVKFCLPTSPAQVAAYVNGFIATVRSVIASFPGKRVLFEPMDEPWNWAAPPGTPSGQQAATEYAAILAGILRASKHADLNPRRYYVPSTGTLSDGSSWITDLYTAQPCLAPGPHTCGPIKGWNVHPYGLPGLTTQGIGEVPRLRKQMRSGKQNVIVSEIGFCATDVANGAQCNQNVPQIDASSAQAANWLHESLEEAAPMHRAGWLKALIIWARAQGGWAMQASSGQLTAQGSILTRFAATAAGH